MRTLRSAFTVIAIALCSSCVVSLNPWFGTDVQVFEERLLGGWWADASDLKCKFRRGPDGTYAVTLIDTHAHERARLRATLGNIGGRLYLDLVLQDGMSELSDEGWWWAQGTHFVGRVDFAEDKVRLNGLDSDKINEMITAGHLRGSAIEGTAIDGGIWFYLPETVMILSSTESLQRFLVEHGQDDSLWAEGQWFERR